MIWKKIKGFESYSISTSGIIVNNDTNRKLSFWCNSNCQKRVTLRKNNKQYNRLLDKLLFNTFGNEIFASTKKSISAQNNYNKKILKYQLIK